METTNLVEREIESEEFDSIEMFQSDTPNQLMAMRKKGQQRMHQHRNNGRAKKGRMSRQADRKGQSTRNRTSRGARARCKARRSLSIDPAEHVEPQVELEGACSETSSTSGA